MLNYTGIPPLTAMADADSRQLIAAELRSLIARVDLSKRLIDAVMTSDDVEPEDDSPTAGSREIFVLDDVTPRFVTASAALNACRMELDHALQQLTETDSPV